MKIYELTIRQPANNSVTISGYQGYGGLISSQYRPPEYNSTYEYFLTKEKAVERKDGIANGLLNLTGIVVNSVELFINEIEVKE